MDTYFNLPDFRLSLRANESMKQIQASPNKSLPFIFRKYAALEGFYRLIKNERVKEDHIMKSISSNTIDSIGDLDEIAIIHDTTFINPKLNKKSKLLGSHGLPTHLSLAVSTNALANVYGAVEIQFLKRDSNNKSLVDNSDYERWYNGVELVENKLKGKSCIHLMDREADSYAHFCDMNLKNHRYVIRVCHDRFINSDSSDKLYDRIKRKRSVHKIKVRVSKREESTYKKQQHIYAKREAREVELNISYDQIIFERGERVDKSYPEECEVNIVRVWEPNPPKGTKPIEWILATSEDIDNNEKLERVIKLYRRRWLIEEFFKGLKTGCKIEEKQFEDVDSWKKIIAFYLPIATKILNLRELDKASIEEIKNCLTKNQISILKKLSSKDRIELQTANDYMHAIARLGGHIKYNGPPGWIVLFRGMQELSTLEIGWSLRCD